MLESTDTIVAPLNGKALGAVSLVRVSGPRTAELARAILPRAKHCLEHPRLAVYSPVFDPHTCLHVPENGALNGALLEEQPKQVLDQALVIFFKAPASYTGEDSLEISLHASPYLLERFLSGLALHGIRLARPGEFTERAFLNGKLDLAQAEAVCDLVSSETEAQARLAREQLSGRLSSALEKIGTPLRELVAEIEALLDFPEEGLDGLAKQKWSENLVAIQAEIELLLSTYSRGKICREGASLVLVGAPNAGKSTLLNKLLGEQRAIVSAKAGTTRDSIEERISLDGICLRITDTAGLRSIQSAGGALDEVEIAGIERSWKRLEEAEIVVFLFDGARPLEEQFALYRQVRDRAERVLPVLNKCDLFDKGEDLFGFKELDEQAETSALSLSSKTGEGVFLLKESIREMLLGGSISSSASVLIANSRHAEALLRAKTALEEALLALEEEAPTEIVSMEIRSALHALAEILGHTGVEDILGLIFSRFCIGK